MTRRAIQTSNAPAAVASYSQAIDTGGYVFCAGQIGLDPATDEIVEGGVEAQAERALLNLTASARGGRTVAGGRGQDDLLLGRHQRLRRVQRGLRQVHDDPPPARSTFAVAALPKGARVEIEAIAVRNDD